MRLAWYAGASAALAGAVVVSAFNQRANFYSAMVHLSQSNLSIMILFNLVMLVYVSFLYGLQRLCFGQLRPVEVEQLYEKGWFAVTETCLAMTIFREEVGAFFIVMFTVLLTGKVWGWIGEGRVEILEQQPPANPRLFHTRLSVSLIVSVLYDVWMLQYAAKTVIQQARPNMMVMFLFEFGILLVCSAQTGLRYIMSLMEQSIIKSQTRHGLEERRKQVRERRAEMLRRRESGEATEAENEEPLPDENDVEEMDIEVPGWEAKGHWILCLDLFADFLKLFIYGAFFVVLFKFHGLPIHIMRDLFMTTRSFIKRLGALLRYRQAVKDLSSYPDATREDLSRENTCIICREEMRPWDPSNALQVERSRPKKLPCGHILHFGCLKSWLERQQVCPTCRSSVVMTGPGAGRNNGEAMVLRVGGGLGGGGAAPGPNGNAPVGAPAAVGLRGPGMQNNAQQPQQQQHQQQHQQQQQGRPGVRMFNLGPIRLGFAQGGPEEIQEMAQMLGMPPDVANAAGLAPPADPVEERPGVAGTAAGRLESTAEQISAQLRAIEHRIQEETLNLRIAEQEAQVLHLLLQQLEAIRANQHRYQATGQDQENLSPDQISNQATVSTAVQQPVPRNPILSLTPPPQNYQTLASGFLPLPPPGIHTTVTRHVTAANTDAIPSGSPDLPEGVTIPAGWSLLPLRGVREEESVAGASSSLHPSQTASSSASSLPSAREPPTAAPGAARASSTVTGSASAVTNRQQNQPSGSQERGVGGSAGGDVPRAAPPSWGGSSQLFDGSSSASACSLSSTDYRNGSTNATHTRDKGKGRAVTVEDEDEESDEEDEESDDE